MSLRAPGWYPDPTDPARLRHWDGEVWDGRERHLPAWVIASDELGPAELAAPPEGALDAPFEDRSLPAMTAPAAGGVVRRRRPLPAAGVWRSPAAPLPQLRPGAAEAPDQRRWSARTRRRGIALFALAALLVLSVSGTVASSLAPPANPLAPDTAFLREANAACVSTLGAVRPVASSAGAGATPTAVMAVGAELSGLAGRIHRLSEAPGATSVVAGWLRLWKTWSAERLAEARALAGEGGTAPASSRPGASSPGAAGSGRATPAAAEAAGTAAGAAASEADSFALHHGLADCSLRYQPTAAILPIP